MGVCQIIALEMFVHDSNDVPPPDTENYYHNKINGVTHYGKVRGIDVLKLGKVNSI
jgi:hypothetical protein